VPQTETASFQQTPVATSRSRRRASLAALTLATTAVVFFALAGVDLTAGLRPLTNRDLTHVVIAGLVACTGLASVGWRSVAARRTAVGSLLALVVAGLVLIARSGHETWPIGDGALIELNVVHALHGSQLLGPYSQYGWHHPGPLMFYLIAPLYWLGGGTMTALNAGALVINFGSILFVAWRVARRTDVSPTFVFALTALLIIYIVRIAPLLTSAWNPHIAILPFAALLVASAEVLAGEIHILPIALLLASFVMQTHVGFVPTALALSALCVGGAVVHGAINDRQRLLWMLLASVAVLEIAWFMPIAEQLVNTPGNMTAIFRFFRADTEGQTWLAGWSAWSAMLLGVFRSDFQLPIGVGFAGSTAALPLVAAIASIAALVPAATLARRSGHPLEAALAVVCFTTSIVGFWAVLRVHGLIGDYHVFWLSILGLMNLAVLAGCIPVGRNLFARAGARLYAAAPAAAVLVAIVLGAQRLSADTRLGVTTTEGVAIRELIPQLLQRLPTTGNHNPFVQFDDRMWGLSTGFALQLTKASVDFTLDPDTAHTFSHPGVKTGHEDILVTIAGPEMHRRLVARAHNVTLAHFADGDLFIDGVSLIDAPQYRP